LFQTLAVWLVLILALVSANLPFISQRLFAVLLRDTPKGLGLRLAELFVFYFLVGGVGVVLEWRAGQIALQGWEFYAISLALFVTLSFPGFIYRYLLNHQPA